MAQRKYESQTGIDGMKNPAFLFYPNDWLGGTMGLSRHHKGCYIDLMVAQFNLGHLSLETIKTILGNDQAAWTVLSSKFKQDSEGNFYNDRLATEILKRNQYINNRVEIGKLGGRPKKNHMVNHKVNHKDNHMVLLNKTFIENENENRNENENSFFSLLLSFLENSVNSLPIEKTKDSRTFHNAIFENLKNTGFECFYEYAIPNGRIDILVKLKNGECVAIELDRRTPRPKNLIKVEELNCRIISILRDPYPDKSYKQFNVDGLILYRGKFESPNVENHCTEGDPCEVEIVEETDFENVWAMYGRKGNRKSSIQKWGKLKNHCKLAALKHIPEYVSATPDIQYRKNFETYINQEAWNDTIISKNDGTQGITVTENGGTMGSGYSGNGAHTFRTDAEKRRNEREVLKKMAIAVLQQPET